LATITNSSSRAIANDASIDNIATSIVHTRIRSTSGRSLALSTEVAVGTFASVNSTDCSAASTTVHARRTESTIGLEGKEVILEISHQSNLAKSSSIISGAYAVSFTIDSTSASTVVLARVVASIANNRSCAIRTSPVRIASALESLTDNVVASSTVQARRTAISKVIFQGVLAENTVEVTRALAHGTSSRYETLSSVRARIHGAKSRNLAPFPSPAGGTHATVLSLNSVIVTHTIVHASSRKSTVEREVSKSILTVIAEVRARAVATNSTVDSITLAVVLARVW